MQVRLDYGGTNYGNKVPAKRYDVTMSSGAEPSAVMNIDIKFAAPMVGLGTRTFGKVESLHLIMSTAAARTLARGILFSLDAPKGTPVRWHCDEVRKAT
jgi:hypothetical protein